MKMLYIDCTAGISGLALLGALVDLGIEQAALSAQISPTAGKEILALSFKKILIQKIACTSVILEVPDDKQPVSVVEFIDDRFRGSWRGKSTVLNKLAKVCSQYAAARSKLLNIPSEEVTEERGVLLQASVIAAGTFEVLEQLDIKRIIASPIPIYQQYTGSPEEPEPFILELARGAKIRQAQYPNNPGTALGVALLLAFVDQYGQLPEMYIDKIGYGALPGAGVERAVVRVLSGTDQQTNSLDCGDEDTLMVLETSIDDMNPEFFPYIVEKLLKLGALDAFLTPIYMKKGRPANLLTVLCRNEILEQALTVIFKEATTLGVRIREEKRRILRRTFFEVNTPYGNVSVKLGSLGQGREPAQIAPEFEDCKQIAIKLGVPIKAVYAAAQRAAFEKSKKPDS